jgi:hypothetical protein
VEEVVVLQPHDLAVLGLGGGHFLQQLEERVRELLVCGGDDVGGSSLHDGVDAVDERRELGDAVRAVWAVRAVRAEQAAWVRWKTRRVESDDALEQQDRPAAPVQHRSLSQP